MRGYILPALLLVAPAAAQELAQTPAGAQRFLAILAEKDEVVDILHQETPVERDKVVRQSKFKPTVISSDQPCRTVIAGPVRVVQASPDFAERKAVNEPPVVIDWSEVETVWAYSASYPLVPLTQVIVRTRHNIFLINLTSYALAQRLHYAGNFLKEHCDKTEVTGF